FDGGEEIPRGLSGEVLDEAILLRRFAGLWAAVGGARKLAELGIPRGQVEILVVERNPYHGIRVRNYEPDLSNVAIPLAEVLDPIGVKHLTAEVEAIDVARQQAVAAAKAL